MLHVCGGILFLGCLLMPSLARAEPQTPDKQERSPEEEVDTEHIFGFAEGSDIGEKGEREIENVNIGSFGQVGAYNNVDTETSFRYGVTDRLRLSIGTLTDYYAIADNPSFTNRTATTFSGVIGEARVKLIDDARNPYGLSLSFNPAFRQFDPLSGVQTHNYSLPVTLLFNAALIPGKFYAAVNLAYTPSFFPIASGTEHDDGLTAIASATYAIGPKIFLGGEIRHETLVQSTASTAHALFLGPTLFYRASPVFTAKVAFEPQVADLGAHTLNLSTYQRYQVELQFAYNF